MPTSTPRERNRVNDRECSRRVHSGLLVALAAAVSVFVLASVPRRAPRPNRFGLPRYGPTSEALLHAFADSTWERVDDEGHARPLPRWDEVVRRLDALPEWTVAIVARDDVTPADLAAAGLDDKDLACRLAPATRLRNLSHDHGSYLIKLVAADGMVVGSDGILAWTTHTPPDAADWPRVFVRRRA